MKIYIRVAALLFVLQLIISCTDERNNSTSNTNRPSNPVTASEVRIGNQTWSTKNLNVDHYRNGDPIPQVTDPAQWINLTSGAWCYYANNSSKGALYGKLYNWFAVNDPRGLAPQGWHVSTKTEWVAMDDYFGGDAVTTLKIKQNANWPFCANPLNTNETGFTALPGGYRNYDGTYYNNASSGIFWTATGYSGDTSNLAWMEFVMCDHVSSFTPEKRAGFSVRCVKN